MLRDYNKGINTDIEYNHLNLPTKVTFSGTNKFIDYIYDATGVKLKKKVTDGSAAETFYAGNYIYEGSSLKFFNHSEGYVEPIDPTDYTLGFNYVYQYKDHLGNVRLSYQDSNNNGSVTSSEILEENNYYPFGLKHKGYNNNVASTNPAQKYKYNGKEFQDELGLNMYDYGARFYDPATARWYTPDALAEKYYDQSTYTYALNNPIIYVDPDGNQVEMCCQGLKDFIFNNTASGKRVLTMGLHNIRPSRASRRVAPEGSSSLTKGVVFLGNSVASVYNGAVDTWNSGMDGADMGQITDEGMASMGKMVRRIENGEATVEDAENMLAAVAMVVVKGKSGKGKKTVKEQASSIKKDLNGGKNSVNVGTVDGVTHYDLEGATHKGVETPHVQTSTKNTNSAGQTFINKNRKDVRPMNQQDIRTVKKVLKKRNENNGG